MVRTELLEIIANGESSRVAFKRDSISTEQLAENIAAVANSKNGCLLLGVEDDGTITGIQRENTEQWVIDTILNKIHPRPWPSYKEIRLNSATVSVIDFSRERLKPYVVRRDNGREEVYVRIGSDSRRATREQQIRLSEAGNLLKVEQLPVSRACMSDLDEARLTCYLRDILCDPDIPKTPEEWKKKTSGFGIYDRSTRRYDLYDCRTDTIRKESQETLYAGWIASNGI